MVNGIARPVIVGIDPGTTSAVAVLSLDHELLGTKSAKNFSKDQIIRYIIEHGNPVIVAADVARTPSLVESVAANMGAATFTPTDDLPAQDKENITQRFDIQSRDTHTMDATAAATYAYREYEGQLRRVKQRALDAGLEQEQVFDVIARVIGGNRSAQQAIQEAADDAPQSEQSTASQPDQDRSGQGQDWQRIAGKRQEQIDRLTAKVEHLQDYVETLEAKADNQEQNEGHQPRVDEEELKRRNREINDLRQELSAKETRVEQLEAAQETLQAALENIVNDDWIYVPETRKLQNAPAAIVYCDGYTGGPVSNEIDTVITNAKTAETRRDAYDSLARQGVTVATLSALDHVELEQGYVVSPDDLERAERGAGSERFLEWLETYKNRQTM